MKQSVEEAAKRYADKMYYPADRGVLHKETQKDFIAGAKWEKKKSPWIREKDRVPIPVIEAIDGNEYGSIDVLGAIQNSYGDYDYYICRYWGYNKEYRWENGIVPDYWMPIPKV